MTKTHSNAVLSLPDRCIIYRALFSVKGTSSVSCYTWESLCFSEA